MKKKLGNQNEQFIHHVNPIKRYTMYKAKKQWMKKAIVFGGLILGFTLPMAGIGVQFINPVVVQAAETKQTFVADVGNQGIKATIEVTVNEYGVIQSDQDMEITVTGLDSKLKEVNIGIMNSNDLNDTQNMANAKTDIYTPSVAKTVFPAGSIDHLFAAKSGHIVIIINDTDRAEFTQLSVPDRSGFVDVDQNNIDDTVDARKGPMKNDLDAEATKVQGEIDNDSTLSATEKTNQKDAVTAEVTKAKDAVDQAKDVAGLNKAKGDGIKAIDAQHQAGTGIDVLKDQAKNDLDAEATKIDGEIDNDPTLTTAEKTSQKAAVATETTKAKTAIDQAADIAGVNQAKADGITNIGAQHQAGTGIDVLKDQAKNDLDAEATKVQGEIDNDPTLTTAEKTNQKAAVTDEVDKGKKAIDQAPDVEGVNQAKTDGIKKIDDQHQTDRESDV